MHSSDQGHLQGGGTSGFCTRSRFKEAGDLTAVKAFLTAAFTLPALNFTRAARCRNSSLPPTAIREAAYILAGGAQPGAADGVIRTRDDDVPAAPVGRSGQAEGVEE